MYYKSNQIDIIDVNVIYRVRTEPSSVGYVTHGGTYSLGFKSSTWQGCSYFSEFIPLCNGVVLSAARDVPAQSFGGDHRHSGRVCVHAFIGISVRTCWPSTYVLVQFAKKCYI